MPGTGEALVEHIHDLIRMLFITRQIERLELVAAFSRETAAG